ISVPGTACGVNLARCGDLAIVADTDGRLRWHRWSDGKERLARFVHRRHRRWVCCAPTCQYVASPGAEGWNGCNVHTCLEQRAERVDILIDGRPAARGFDRVPKSSGRAGVGNVTVTLPSRDVEVALIARSGELASEPARVRLTFAGAAPTRGEDLLKPKLY